MDILESKLCPVTGLAIDVRDEWQLSSGDYSCGMGVIADSIVVAEPRGISIKETTELFLDTFESIVEAYPETKKFVIIDNYTGFKRATHEARRKYIQYLNSYNKVAMIIYMGLSRTIYLSVNIGKMINYLHFPIKISKNYFEAITEAMKQINALKDEEDSFSNYQEEEELMSLNSYISSDSVSSSKLEKIMSNPIVNVYVEEFNKYLTNIKWNDYSYELPLIPGVEETHPLNVLRESLTIVKSDVSELISEFIRQEQKLVDAQDELKELNSNLENLVKLRTNELLRVNKELKKAKEEAELANKSKSVFLASISHELKTPLNSIMSYSSMGVSKIEQIKKDKVSSYFSQINTSGKRLLGLIEDLIDITKFEAGAMTFNFVPNDILLTLTKATSEISSLSDKKQIKINLNTNLKSSVFVFDSQRILQVFVNILSNSVKFTSENKNIYITLSDNDKELICSIKDEGIGLEEDEYESIFNTFKRGKKSIYSSGTGLGLAISRNIIKAHHGKIWAENNEEGGSKFTFIISKHCEIR